ncbi:MULTISPECIES: hypothetical protein [unclassified Methylophilus]|uniref:hypothetical protein n=1 Tax=unclassified Methylophilus TaxID=2630143 RepID=UPI0023B29435|nr:MULTISPECIES: hypothetical protein [unclassified Methylophilus]MDF0377415.1 hypothetical protein [Methylophilus sp. YYY-1]MDT7849487.1 hypothetical protein [Methylophilus sp. VKM B-3414]
MKKRMLLIIGMTGYLLSMPVWAGTNPSPHDQVEMQRHLKIAKHAGAQPAVSSQKEIDKKTAQTK